MTETIGAPDQKPAPFPIEYDKVLASAERRTDNVAIVGSCHTTRDLAPHGNPKWTVWGINEIGMGVSGSWHAFFNVHTLTELRRDYPRNLEWLAGVTCPVYLQERVPEVPWSIPFPVHDVLALAPRKNFDSGIAWMIGLAILQGYKKIGLFGVEMMIHSEYQHQRPNLHYWIGYCDAKGIEFHIPEKSTLMRARHLYGYEDPPSDEGAIRGAMLAERMRKAANEKYQHEIEAARRRGAVEELSVLMAINDQWRRDNPYAVVEEKD